MAGPAFYFQVLQQATAQLKAGSPADQANAALLEAHPAHAHLGALGPDVLRYTLLDPALLERVAAVGVAGLNDGEKLQVQRSPLMLCYGTLYRELVLELWPFLEKVHTLYDQMDAVAAAEDTDGLAGLRPAFDAVAAGADALSDLSEVGDRLRKNAIAPAVVLGPVIQTDFPLATRQWRAFEFLRWVRTGKFARRLLELAAGNGPLQAFALGWQCHVAAAVTGEPFVANVTGGPYRTHWWRNRYVGNYVDAWTHGFFATPATMGGDEPTPAYAAWKALCGEKLHERIAFASPPPDGMEVARGVAQGPVPAGLVPDDVAGLLVQAVKDVYDFGALDLAPDDLEAPETWQRAYAGLYSVLWLTTGGTGPLCPSFTATPPAGCSTDPPPWVTGGGTPPTPVKESGGSTGSSVALAILAVILFLTGNWALGLAAVGGAIAAAEGGAEVDWAQLRCNLFWQRKKLFDIEQGLRDLLVVAGLAYPAPHQLGTVGPEGKTAPTTGIQESNRVLCRAAPSEERFPFRMDASKGLPDVNFLQYPSAAELEEPTTQDFQSGYPDQVVAGPLQNGGMLKDGPAFPTSETRFGGAVANAVAVMRAGAAGLADYNLDGDRGYGWKDWFPKAGTKPKDGVVDAQPIS